jgi:hypothetical protein
VTRHTDRGTASIEFAVLLPLLLFAGLVALQVGAVMWTAVSTSEAARQTARAAMLNDRHPSPGYDLEAVADDSLPDPLQVLNSRINRHRVELDVRAPRVVPGFSFTVTRSADLP